MTNLTDIAQTTASMLQNAFEHLRDGKHMSVADAENFLKLAYATPGTLTDSKGDRIPLRTIGTPDANEQNQYFRGLGFDFGTRIITGTFYAQKTTPTRFEPLPNGYQPQTRANGKQRVKIRTKIE